MRFKIKALKPSKAISQLGYIRYAKDYGLKVNLVKKKWISESEFEKLVMKILKILSTSFILEVANTENHHKTGVSGGATKVTKNLHFKEGEIDSSMNSVDDLMDFLLKEFPNLKNKMGKAKLSYNAYQRKYKKEWRMKRKNEKKI